MKKANKFYIETKPSWNDLSIEEKRRIIKLADNLGISPMFVQDMYENGQIS